MKLNRRGLIATIVYHILLLLLLVLAGLTYPVPPPGEEGILVNFGTDETGLGEMEPAGDDQQAGDPELPVSDPIQDQVEESTPVTETLPEEQQQAVTPPPREQQREDQTQDLEETRVVEPPQPTPEEIERQRQAELERQRQAELERQRLEQERIERERREEQERIERERQQQAERLNNLGRNAFGRQGSGEGEGAEGVTEGSGNQGVTTGDPNADRYDTGGGLGDGPSVGGLGSRRVVGKLPIPDVTRCEVTSRIVIQVAIQVNQDGKVVRASIENSTFSDNCINSMVLEAARNSQFTPDANAESIQTGWIRYTIVP